MEFEEPEAFLARMAEVGATPLDNQAVSNSLDRGFDSFSVTGALPGQESLISENLRSALPEPEPALTKAAEAEQTYSFTAKLPGLT